MIGIIGAMSLEIEHIKAHMENIKEEKISGIPFTTGTLYGKDLVVAVCGIGKVFAAICAQTMILKYSPEIIINTGVAGTLTDRLGILDIAIGKDVVQYDIDTTALGDPKGLISGINVVKIPASAVLAEKTERICTECGIKSHSGTIASGDRFLHDRDEKESLADEFSAVACEMEGGAIAQVCYVNNVDFIIIRSISDGDGGNLDYEKFKVLAAKNSCEVILNLFKKMDA